MEAIFEEHIVAEIIEEKIKKQGEKVSTLQAPKDKYLLCHLLFFFLGVCHIVPTTFFSTANNFWMYTFRNLSDPTMAPENRIDLQKHFASIAMIVNTVPALFLGICNILYGHKFRIVHRIFWTLGIQMTIFLILTAFVKINKDNYQTGFFIIVMACSGVLNGANIVNVVSCTLLFPRFPHEYMQTLLSGESVAAIIGDVLNIISVWMFRSITDATLMYFLFGTVLMIGTLILYGIMARSEFFKHCFNTMPEDHTKKMPTKKDIINIMYKMRLIFFVYFVALLNVAATHTAITSLVVSEQKSGDSIWARTYFTPLVTFFLTDLCALIGRFLAMAPVLQNLPDLLLCIISLATSVTLVPLIWFCNAQPRLHLAVLFPHDYQYAIILGLLMVEIGYMTNMGILLVPRKINLEESELAYNVLNFVMGFLSTSTSVVGIFIVNIL